MPAPRGVPGPLSCSLPTVGTFARRPPQPSSLLLVLCTTSPTPLPHAPCPQQGPEASLALWEPGGLCPGTARPLGQGREQTNSFSPWKCIPSRKTLYVFIFHLVGHQSCVSCPEPPRGRPTPPQPGLSPAPRTSCRQGRSWRQPETTSSSQPELLKSSRVSSSVLGTNAGGLQVPRRHVAYKSG